MIGSNNGVPDTKYLLTKELTLEDAAWRTQLPSSQDRTDNVGPIGFIFKEGEVLCMKCRKKFRCQTTEKKVVYDCHAKSAGGHQEAPESDTYVIQIVGKEVFIPNKVGFDREGIVKSAVPVPDPEGSNVADLVGIRHITSSIVTSRQSTGTMPGTSGPPSPTLKPSASSSAKPKPTSSSKTPRKQKFKILSKRAKKPEADDDRESDLEVVAIVNNSSGAITRRNGDDSDDSTSSIELIEIVPRESSR